jgi:opacity protein-like surface antigen
MRRIAIFSLFLFVHAGALWAQSREITPFAGIRYGGSVASQGRSGDVDSSADFGLMLSFQRDPQAVLDFVLSHQSSAGDLSDFYVTQREDVGVTYAQVGGRYLFHPEAKLDPYIAVTVGATRIAVAGDWAIAFSFAGGAGVDIRMTPRTAIRLDGRYYTTLRDTATQIDCSVGTGGQCSLFSSGRNFTQVALTAGLAVKF